LIQLLDRTLLNYSISLIDLNFTLGKIICFNFRAQFILKGLLIATYFLLFDKTKISCMITSENNYDLFTLYFVFYEIMVIFDLL
jgi:hypothetical protein